MTKRLINRQCFQWFMLLMIACVGFLHAQTAEATACPYGCYNNDVGGYNPSSYWSGVLPLNETWSGLSTDTVLPLALTLYSYNVDASTALQFIEVTVSSENDPSPIAGTLSYHPELYLVLWSPVEELAPSTTYFVSIVVNNEGLSELGPGAVSNLTGRFTFTTAAEKLPTAPLPVIAEMRAEEFLSSDWVACPSGQEYIDYTYYFYQFYVSWRDGEADGTNLFFAYQMKQMDQEWAEAEIAGTQVLINDHDAYVGYGFDPNAEPSTDRYCIELHTSDLRSVARGTEAQDHRKIIRCVEMPPLANSAREAAEEALTRCSPYNWESPSSDGFSSPPSDTTSDTSSRNPSDDTTCSCNNTRRSSAPAPLGLLIGVFAVGIFFAKRHRAQTRS